MIRIEIQNLIGSIHISPVPSEAEYQQIQTKLNERLEIIVDSLSRFNEKTLNEEVERIRRMRGNISKLPFCPTPETVELIIQAVLSAEKPR